MKGLDKGGQGPTSGCCVIQEEEEEEEEEEDRKSLRAEHDLLLRSFGSDYIKGMKPSNFLIMSELPLEMDDTKIIGYSTNTELSQKEQQRRQWKIKRWDEEILEA
jgi:succinate dehydrogenase flavin-adding protein (antitoxin of CptAB toxin-antitoxin module)